MVEYNRVEKSMDEITIWLASELKEALQMHAAERGESVQDFLTRAIQETMLSDTRPKHALDGEANIQYIKD